MNIGEEDEILEVELVPEREEIPSPDDVPEHVPELVPVGPRREKDE